MSEALAWAAGLFDGEGCTSRTHHLRHGERTGRFGLQVSMTQDNDPTVLIRLQEAVGVGKIYGPYAYRPPNGADRTGQYHWRANGVAALDALVRMWPWLSLPKRTQAVRILEEYAQQPPPMSYTERGRRAIEIGSRTMSQAERGRRSVLSRRADKMARELGYVA